jgi:O-antigen/teichoic acid export membrane protein
MDVLVLGALTDARSVGFYSLAVAIAYALGLPVTGLASALFPRMARGGPLRAQWLALAWLSGAVSLVAALLLARPVIELIFSPSYSDAAGLVVPLTLAQTVRGVTSIYNSYLSANRHGSELRNASVVLTVSNLIFVFAFIPPFGATGAAWASVLALAANLAAHIYGYRRTQRARAAGEAE